MASTKAAMAGSQPAVTPTLTPIGVPGGDDDTPSASPSARVEVGGRVKQAYSAIQSCTGGVGGDGSQGPIYGEMTIGSMQRVLDCFVADAGFGPESVFMDVGSGLGKPNIHAACMPSGCRFSIGVECEPTRYNLSMVNLQRLVEQDTMIRERCNLFFILANILRMRSLTPVTHLFSFDVGMPHRILRHLARLFHASPTCRYIMVFRQPAAMAAFGFQVRLVRSISVSMSGSGERHTGMVYERVDTPPPLPPGLLTSAPCLPTAASTAASTRALYGKRATRRSEAALQAATTTSGSVAGSGQSCSGSLAPSDSATPLPASAMDPAMEAALAVLWHGSVDQVLVAALDAVGKWTSERSTTPPSALAAEGGVEVAPAPLTATHTASTARPSSSPAPDKPSDCGAMPGRASGEVSTRLAPSATAAAVVATKVAAASQAATIVNPSQERNHPSACAAVVPSAPAQAPSPVSGGLGPGSKVRARWQGPEKGYRGKWYVGHVQSVNADGTYRVQYVSDGSVNLHVPPDAIQPHPGPGRAKRQAKRRSAPPAKKPRPACQEDLDAALARALQRASFGTRSTRSAAQ